MRAGKVLAEQAQFAQAVRRHEVGVVNDGHEHFAGAMDAEGLLHQQAFAVMVAALELDLEGFAEDAQGVVVGVQRAVDDGVIMRLGSWVRSACLRTLLPVPGSPSTRHRPPCWAWTRRMSKISCWWASSVSGFRVEGIALETKVGADHRLNFGCGCG